MEVQYVSWTRQSAAFFCCVAKLGESLTGRCLFAYVRGSQEDNSRRFSSFICICQRFVIQWLLLLVVDDIYLHLSEVCNSLTVKVRQGVGVRLKALPHFFHGSDEGSGFAGWNLGTVIKTTFTPSGLSSSIHGLGISPLGPLFLLLSFPLLTGLRLAALGKNLWNAGILHNLDNARR